MDVMTAERAPLVVVGSDEDLTARARDYTTHAKAPSTLKSYRSDWSQFRAWCEGRFRESLPATPETVALFLTDMAERYKVATLGLKLVAISQAHKSAGYPSPVKDAVVQTVWQGIRRTLGTAQTQKTPVLTDDLRRMFQRLPNGIRGLRDRAMLLVGYAGGFRRSEIVSLDLADVDFRSDGVVIHLRRSKVDQEGAGRLVGIPFGSDPDTCPVRSLRAYIDATRLADGPLFPELTRHGRLTGRRTTGRVVARAVQRYAAAVGLDASRYGGHSLRTGLVTQAAQNGATEAAIMRQTGHRSVLMLRRYVRNASVFQDNAATKLSL